MSQIASGDVCMCVSLTDDVATINALARGGVDVTVYGNNPDKQHNTWLPSVRHVPDALHTHLMCVVTG